MRKLLSRLIFSVFLSIVLVNCANRGTPSGGEVDTTPPEIIKSVPENYSTNFSGTTIRVQFNEYVKIKELQKQLIISPPMDTPPEVTPLGGASKSINIKIFDTLQPNTTYAFNFGESIVDNNEENPYPYYRYVFSTGDHIDSLSIKGDVVDALEKYTDEFVSVFLYERDSTFTDSIVYNKKPKYVTNTLDSTTTFSLDNLRAGSYLLTALKETTSNYTFQPKTDKIGFVNKVVTLPADTSKYFTIKLFKEVLDFRATRPSYISENRIAFGYEGNTKDTEIKVLSEVPNDFNYRITKEIDKDTLNYWYQPKIETDSLVFEVSNINYKDTLIVRLPKRDKDTLTISQVGSRTLLLDEDFKFTGSLPLETIDDTRISIMDKDSIILPHSSELDIYNNIASLSFEKKSNEEEGNNYRIELLPGAIIDFYGSQNDTLNYAVNTRSLVDYGQIRINLSNAVYPIIVQLTDKDGIVKAEQYAIEENKPIDFKSLTPGDYYLRAIFDTNKNGVYDTGNYLLKQQPERVSHASEVIDIKAYFDQVITFPLSKEE